MTFLYYLGPKPTCSHPSCLDDSRGDPIQNYQPAAPALGRRRFVRL